MTKSPAKGQKTQALYALLWMPKLSPAARAVGGWLVWHANASTGRCDPGQARLQKETGLSRRTIQNAVKELISSGVVSRKLRENQSSSYQIHWQKLSDLVAAYEELANTGEEVVAPRERRKEGAVNCAPLAQETAPTLAQETAPKLSEGNPRKEHVFRGGTISDGSESGVHTLRYRSEVEEGGSSGFDMGALAKALIHPDDMFAIKMLGIQEDHAFVAVLDRELRNGRLFGRQIADHIYDRLEAIRDSDEATHGDPVAGRAYRLFETDFCREEAA
ncbi:hypothetical protein CO661_12035 [Sinorhizobium fredii]|uniref:Helix-turn-helix domain-containing protein n=1 Tax=Rhizobium fredii TaxID=380 RepID=A0A2A6LY34_RHIFR|nr:helix-turn-helix domain-containing protein [Sinorhizobium fredii]PDT47464.1 hypothetical protein CO661_12035 [Sinorhizobium fredii]